MPRTTLREPDDQAKFWRLPAVIKFTQRSRSAIYRDATFPRPVKLGPNTSAWLVDEVRAWAANAISQSRPVRRKNTPAK